MERTNSVVTYRTHRVGTITAGCCMVADICIEITELHILHGIY